MLPESGIARVTDRSQVALTAPNRNVPWHPATARLVVDILFAV